VFKSASVHILVGLVLYGESQYVLETLAALEQQDLDLGTNISLAIVDNGIPDAVQQEIFDKYSGKVAYIKNFKNLGFSAGVNQCLEQALKFEADFLLLLNPDLLLETVCVRELIRATKRHEKAALFTPKLLRANSDLSPTTPSQFDACGMKLESSLRHLDIYSGQIDKGQAQKEKEVFGGTGACLLIRLSGISNLLLPRNSFETDLWRLYPELEQGSEQRPQLLDESFFAYREDADLAIRAQLKSFKYIYCPLAIGHHVRRVLPERRQELPAEINRLGVRNRFLLQINNISFCSHFSTLFNGLIFRNITVILAVIFKETSSLSAFKDLWILRRRAFANRKYNLDNADIKNLNRWILNRPNE
jgi:GT2 family glycosyltransferase